MNDLHVLEYIANIVNKAENEMWKSKGAEFWYN